MCDCFALAKCVIILSVPSVKPGTVERTQRSLRFPFGQTFQSNCIDEISDCFGFDGKAKIELIALSVRSFISKINFWCAVSCHLYHMSPLPCKVRNDRENISFSQMAIDSCQWLVCEKEIDCI